MLELYQELFLEAFLDSILCIALNFSTRFCESSFSYYKLNCLRQRAIICINYCYVIEGNVEREIEEV